MAYVDQYSLGEGIFSPLSTRLDHYFLSSLYVKNIYVCNYAYSDHQ